MKSFEVIIQYIADTLVSALRSAIERIEKWNLVRKKIAELRQWLLEEKGWTGKKDHGNKIRKDRAL